MKKVIKSEADLLDFFFKKDWYDGIDMNQSIGLVQSFNPEIWYIYYLKDYTAPKVFNGLYYECLVTDQNLPANTPIYKSCGLSLKDWPYKIHKPERFYKAAAGA